MENGQTVDKISFIASYVTLYFLYIFPIAIIAILIKEYYNKGTLDDPKFQERYGPLILDLRTASV